MTGQLMLLPNTGPFFGSRHCRDVFLHPEKENTGLFVSTARELVWRCFVRGCIVARPQSVLQLPPLTPHDVRVDMDGDWETVCLIDRFVKRMRKTKLSSKHEELKAKQIKQKASFLVKARRLSQHPMLLEAIGFDDEYLQAVVDLKRSFVNYVMQKRLPVTTQLENLTNSQLCKFRAFHKKHDPIPTDFNTPLPKKRSKVEKKGDKPAVQEDSTMDSDKVYKQPKPFLIELRSEMEWLQRLSNADDKTIFSSRIKTIMDLVGTIQNKHPSEGMLIISPSSMFLDIIKEALKRSRQTKPSLEIPIYECNESLSIREKHERAHNFNLSTNSRGAIMLMKIEPTQRIRLDLSGASHIIVVDTFLSHKTRTEVYRSVRSLSQTKTVHVWNLFAPLSAADDFGRTYNLGYGEGNDEDDPFFVRHDDEE